MSVSSAEPAGVRIENIRKVFPGGVAAVDGVSLDIASGEFFALLGPSGCGKTTLLRMIAGLEIPTGGTLAVGGVDMTFTPADRRPVHLVFQHYALFPHLSVEKNVAFGLRYQGIRGAEAKRRVDEALELVRLPGYGKRKPDQLSGGQRQRVALARALVLQPKVLLLDEPFGALDQKLRREMQLELKRLQQALRITFIFVTHDQEEALLMSDRIAVMHHGKVEQVDAAERLFERPRTRFVADFMGAANFLEARAVGEAPGRMVIESEPAGYRAEIPSEHVASVGKNIQFIVRPEKLLLRLTPGGADSFPYMKVTVEDRSYQGVSTVWTVRNGAGERLTIYEQNNEAPGENPSIRIGDKAFACWDPRHSVILESAEPGGAV